MIAADALKLRRSTIPPAGLLFLDPPYGSGLLAECCAQLAAADWVRQGGLIYLENAGDEALPLPPTWTLLRSKRAGQVGYHLAKQEP